MGKRVSGAGVLACCLFTALAEGQGKISPNGRGNHPIGFAGSTGSATASDLLNYNGGPVMTGQTHIYYIYYGDWSVDPNAAGILSTFANNLNGSAYYNILTQYSSGSGNSAAFITNSVVLSGTANSTYTAANPTNLSDSDIQGIVQAAISNHSLPLDANGVYFVLTAPGVGESSGFLSSYCGWHTAAFLNNTWVKYAFVGDAGNNSGCSVQFGNSPNGDPPVDAMISVLAHELSETVTDPILNAWYDASGNEIGDKCAWNFGTTFTAPNGSTANATLGGFDYLIQQEFSNASDSCVMTYASTPDYALSVSPGSQSAVQGTTTGSYTVTITPTSGFSGSVNLSLSGLPSGATASGFSANPATTTSSFNVNIGTAAVGTYTLTITGTSGSLTHSATATLVVGATPDFSLSLSPTSQSANQGTTTGNYTVTINPASGFSGKVSLSLNGLPSGATSSGFSSNPATTSSNFNVNTGTAAAGTYTLTITGTSGSLTHSTTATLVIGATPDFSLSLSPASQSAAQGTSTANYTVTINPKNGFSGSVNLSVSGLPSGATAGVFSSNPATTSSSFNVNAGTAAPGTYTFTITGTSGSLTHSTTATVVVSPQGSFAISVAPAAVTLSRKSSGSYAVTITPSGGFNSPVSLSVSGLPSHVTGSFSPKSVTGSGTSTLTISAGPSAPTGSNTLTITGTSGSLKSSISVVLIVN
jgi:hypothetical protein